MRFDLFESDDTDGTDPALSWDNGHLSGQQPALDAFHERVLAGEPVLLAAPADEQPPGSETWHQFLATAYELPFSWDDVSGDDAALDALAEFAGSAAEGQAVN